VVPDVSVHTRKPSFLQQLAPLSVGVAMLFTIGWGWSIREGRYVIADEGLGYWLGLAGLGCMTVLLFYSVRKRVPSLRGVGRIRRWLSVHMMLGLVGPLLVLFHANFRLGSLNSNVALACVLLVAASGVIGRLLYPKIHHGLTGRRATLAEVRSGTESLRERVTDAAVRVPGLVEDLAAIDDLAARSGGVATLFVRTLAFWRRTLALRRRYPALWERRTARDPDELANYVGAVGGALSFRLYERLFALWHAFHLPFCVLLFAAAAVHVLAVHLY
jgi:hypothetical protein